MISANIITLFKWGCRQSTIPEEITRPTQRFGYRIFFEWYIYIQIKCVNYLKVQTKKMLKEVFLTSRKEKRNF